MPAMPWGYVACALLLAVGLGFALLFLVAIAAAERAPVTEDDGVTPEAPYLPRDFKPARPLPRRNRGPVADRLKGRVRRG